MVANSVTTVRYGCASKYFPGSHCPRCDASIDSHSIPGISPSDYTTGLARKFQGLLDNLDIEAILHGYDPLRTSTMVGAARAYFGNSTCCSYVAVSGHGSPLYTLIDRGKLGLDIILADTPKSLMDIKGNKFAPPTLVKPVPKYGIGNCAAQKLLTKIFDDARSRGGVTGIEMSEIMWRSSTVERVAIDSRQWRTGDVVPSCDICKQILPLMLCDKQA